MRMLHHGQIHCDLPHTSLPRDLRARLMASSPRKSVVGIWPTGNGSPDPAKPAALLVTVKDKSLRDGCSHP
ncbi:hypothetical protein EFV37_32530 [Mesorhizobium loti]|nr:hypothetical protein A9174_31825 [Mesorhizobium loti NZP2037]OBQ66474.1 hypothetical protein A9K72_34740 [Mesorhizobium loti]QKC66422.1 hypothetical protein EB229_32520 [Mesorhizobium jarvisii]QKD12335.1 hypothetical protein EFV37_32530 [Mesorhizobium loti]